ncbi:MAG: archaellin/type IV pilin N-terminal domain-containing protein [Candidatus Pacearchaeota archaeon]
MKKNKRGVSALVATVLLVLITIAAVGIIWGAILPLIRKGLGTTQACGIETRLDIEKRGYTCFNLTGKNVLVEISRPITLEGLTKILVQVSGEGRTEVYEIANGTGSPNVKMYPSGTTIELPSKGGSRTYNISAINFNATQVGVIPVVQLGTQTITCQTTATVDLSPC